MRRWCGGGTLQDFPEISPHQQHTSGLPPLSRQQPQPLHNARQVDHLQTIPSQHQVLFQQQQPDPSPAVSPLASPSHPASSFAPSAAASSPTFTPHVPGVNDSAGSVHWPKPRLPRDSVHSTDSSSALRIHLESLGQPQVNGFEPGQ